LLLSGRVLVTGGISTGITPLDSTGVNVNE
jgi:hypothetical protein